MSDYRRIGALVLIMSVVALAIGGIAIWVLYGTAFDQKRADLAQKAMGRGQLIEVVLQLVEAKNPLDDPLADTIRMISDAHDAPQDYSDMGEFWLARAEQGQIVFQMHHAHLAADKPAPVPLDSPLAEPMRRALAGISGTLTGLDFRGVPVLAAHQPIQGTDLGIVASVELADIRAPFIRAALIVAAVALVLIGLGTALFLRVTNPMIRRLTEARSQYEDLYENAPIAYGSLSIEEGRFLHHNAAFAALTGYSRAEMKTLRVSDLYPPDRTPKSEQIMGSLMAGGAPLDVEILMRRKDGSDRWVRVTATPRLGENGRPTEARSVATDITDRRVAEQKLEKAKDELEDRVKERTRDLEAAKKKAELADRSKTEFLANTSHELRTPLNAIIGFSELMQSRAAGALSVKQGEYIGDIRQSGLHLLSIINDILDLSKIDSETAVISETPVNLHQVASSSMALVADRAHVAGVGLVNAVPTTLPEIAADVRMLKQMMNNLLSNAVKFTHRDGRVNVGAETNPDASVSIWVADTGIGMRPEEISIALSKFGQVDAGLNRKYQGAGLGLPLVAAQTELHGGKLKIASQHLVGTTVTIQFPASRTVTESPSADAAE